MSIVISLSCTDCIGKPVPISYKKRVQKHQKRNKLQFDKRRQFSGMYSSWNECQEIRTLIRSHKKYSQRGVTIWSDVTILIFQSFFLAHSSWHTSRRLRTYPASSPAASCWAALEGWAASSEMHRPEIWGRRISKWNFSILITIVEFMSRNI